MFEQDKTDFRQFPGLYRLWDLQFILNREDLFQVHYAEQTGDGTPLFSVWQKREAA